MAPFLPRYKGDYITDVDLNVSATDHYLTALVMRRKAQEMLAIFGGKMPHEIAILPGGATEKVTVKMILEYASRLREIQPFIENAYIPDVLAIAKAYSQYFSIGRGSGNLMSYGVFEEGGTGTRTFIPSGVYIDGKIGDFSPSKITEHVKHSKYSSASGKHPSEGETITDLSKKDAYSWLKSPRYDDKVVEVGPLARMGISHLLGSRDKTSRLVTDTLQSAGVTFDDMFSVMGRHAARALECKLLADRAAEWITQLKPGEPTHTKFEIPENSTGMGLTEAPRGSLGHWITIKNKKIDHYQVVVGTTWNCSPRDDHGQPGPLEQALVGTPIADPENPIEAARVVRSFDPCLACAIHVVTPDKELVSSLALA